MSKKRLKDTSREGVFRQYMAGILKYPKLSLEEQQDLARKWRDFADKEAFDRLVKCNLRFVVREALYYSQRYNFPLMDLIQEGNNGLIKAVQRYDPERGYKVLAIGEWWIKQFIRAYLVQQLFNHPLGVSLQETAVQNGPDGSPLEELLDLDSLVHVDGSSNNGSLEDAILKHELLAYVHRALVWLSHKKPVLSEVIRMRYLDSDRNDVPTFRELEKRVDVTFARVQQLDAEAVEALKKLLPQIMDQPGPKIRARQLWQALPGKTASEKYFRYDLSLFRSVWGVGSKWFVDSILQEIEEAGILSSVKHHERSPQLYYWLVNLS
jgi:RNA polymerase sigma factor (sigma-70 family)